MIKNYLKVTLRNLLREKTYAAIKISGLAVGLASVMLIALYIQNEFAYDRFHKDGDRIYRILRWRQDSEGRTQIGATSAPYAAALQNDFPAMVEETMRVASSGGVVTYEDKTIYESQFYFADPNFFSFFSYPLIHGDAKQTLKEPASVVISEAMAKKYFGDASPIGKILRYDNQTDLKVTGVFGKPPGNSHITFDFVAPFKIFEQQMPWLNNWWNNSLFTYVRLAPNASSGDLEKLLPSFMDKYLGDHFKSTGRRTDLCLESLPNIYLNEATQFDLIEHGDRTTLYIFAAVSFLILLIATINFVNLSTARSLHRSKEVGLRKVIGANRLQLILQFIGESLLIALLAFLIALMIVELTLPSIQAFLDKPWLWTEGLPWPMIGMFTLGAAAVGILAGFYPALVLAAFQPAAVLKGSTAIRRSTLWKILVTLQFALSVVLIVGSLLMNQQLDYITTKNMGYDAEQIVLIPLRYDKAHEQRHLLKQRILSEVPALQVTAVSGEPGGMHDTRSFFAEGHDNVTFRISTIFSDFDYLKTFQLTVVSGRDFSTALASDSSAAIINESAVRALGWTNASAIGKKIRPALGDTKERTVIGVVQDYHYRSLKTEIGPLIISINEDNRVLAVKLRTRDYAATLKQIEQLWSTTVTGYPFDYRFMDAMVERMYRKEIKQRQLLTVFTAIAVTVACLGLLALASYSAQRRAKEIGIRKVLGASIASILKAFAYEFLVLVLIANVLAFPLIWWSASWWLQGFAYRITIGPEMFVLGIVASLVVAGSTIAYQAYRAASANPVDALKYE